MTNVKNKYTVYQTSGS